MSVRRYTIKALVAGLATMACASADNTASYTINITGYVPVVCHVSSPDTSVVSGQSVDLGTLSEFCNNPAGYQVWADYTPTSTSAVLNVSGKKVPLSSSGSTLIDSSSNASINTRQLNLEGGAEIKSISFRIVPL
jgi:type 1 fimbria pilin